MGNNKKNSEENQEPEQVAPSDDSVAPKRRTVPVGATRKATRPSKVGRRPCCP